MTSLSVRWAFCVVPFLTFTLAICFSGVAGAADYWQECATIGGYYKLDGNKLVTTDDPNHALDYKALRKITLIDHEGYCENKAGNQFSWSNHVYVSEIQTKGTDGPLKLWFICEEGGSSFPASEEIDTKCVKDVKTKNRQLVPTYKNKKK